MSKTFSEIFNRSTIAIVLVGVVRKSATQVGKLHTHALKRIYTQTSMIEYSMVMPSLATYIDDLGGTHILYGVAVGTLRSNRRIKVKNTETTITNRSFLLFKTSLDALVRNLVG